MSHPAEAASGVGRLVRGYSRRRYSILFYSLLITMAAAPASAALGSSGWLIEFFLAANLLIAVIPAGGERSRSVLLAVLTVLGMARMVAARFDHPVLSVTALGIWTIVGLLAAALALRFAIRSGFVGSEHVYAALSAYLLAGILFGLFYWVVEQMRPASFGVTGEFSRMSAVYFSFVTLATLGYGDIVPRTDVARGLAIVEGIGGQLFLAVLVARLVSLYVRNRDEAGRA
jgi:hypothetical protein